MSPLAFLGAELRRHRGPAAGGGDPRKAGRSGIERCDDIAVVTPTRASRWAGPVAQCHGGAALDRDLLQLAVCEESDPLAIRRKERHIGTLGTGERRKLTLIEPACGQASLPAASCSMMAMRV